MNKTFIDEPKESTETSIADKETVNSKDVKKTEETEEEAATKKQFWEDTVGLLLQTNLVLNDVNVQDGLKDVIEKSKTIIEQILSTKIYNLAGNEPYIQALCLITKVDIDYCTMVPHAHLVHMLRDAIFMVSSAEMNETVIKPWKYGKEVVKSITSFRGNPSIGKLLISLRSKHYKDVSKVTNWNYLANTLGIFIPEGSLSKANKNLLLQQAMAVLEKANFNELQVDSFLFARISNYVGLELAYNSSLPGILVDRDITLGTRTILISQFGYDPPVATDKVYGTEMWCAASDQCKVDLLPAIMKCACGKMCHAEYCTLKNKKVVCPYCIIPARHSWATGAHIFPFPLPPYADSSATTASATSTSSAMAATPGKGNSTALVETIGRQATSNSMVASASKGNSNATMPSTGKGASNALTTTTGRNFQNPYTSTGTRTPTTGKGSSQIVTPVSEGPPTPEKASKKQKVGFNNNDQVKIVSKRRIVNTTTTRFSLKFKMRMVTDEEDEFDVLIATIQLIFNRGLIHADNEIRCIPWSASAIPQTSLDIREIATNSDNITDYLPRVTPKPGQFIYTEICLTYELVWEDIQREINNWFRARNFSLYPKQLQVERTVNIGWILYSHPKYNKKSLIDCFRTRYRMDVDIRWMIVRIARNEDLGDTPVQALMVVAPSDYKNEYRKAFHAIYNRGTSYPLSISMKFIPVQFQPSRRVLKQSKNARAKQGIWQGTVESHTVDFMTDLDWHPPHVDDDNVEGIPNLRTIILSTKTVLSNHNLFISVDVGYKDNLTTFVFPTPIQKRSLRIY